MSKYRNFVHKGMIFTGYYDQSKVYYKNEIMVWVDNSSYVCQAERLDVANAPDLTGSDWYQLTTDRSVTIDNVGNGTDPANMFLKMTDSAGVVTIIFDRGEVEDVPI